MIQIQRQYVFQMLFHFILILTYPSCPYFNLYTNSYMTYILTMKSNHPILQIFDDTLLKSIKPTMELFITHLHIPSSPIMSSTVSNELLMVNIHIRPRVSATGTPQLPYIPPSSYTHVSPSLLT